jgi:hypothetical protein
MSIIDKIRRNGFRGSLVKAINLFKNRSGYTLWRVRNAPVFANPTPAELLTIERDLESLGIAVYDYSPPPPVHSRHFKPQTGFRLTTAAGCSAGCEMKNFWNTGSPQKC